MKYSRSRIKNKISFPAYMNNVKYSKEKLKLSFFFIDKFEEVLKLTKLPTF